MRIYITIPFKGGENIENAKCLCSLARKGGFEDFCFVRDVKKEFENSKNGRCKKGNWKV